MQENDSFDVAILGTGITGSILGAILARNGVRTLLIEQGVHPRFAIGESTVPETTFQFRVLAYRYGVPEIANLSNHQRVRRYIAPTSGVKRNFSFVYHRPGEEPRPKETNQLPTLSPPLGPDVHLFRQDVDSHLLTVAASYGAHVRQRTDIVDVAIDGGGVRLKARSGEVLRAQYVVDCGGIKSPLAQTFGLRDSPPKMRTRSRSLFTHMHGVRPFDACMAPASEHGLPSPLSQGTLHHIFEGGWMWVIPFNNHPNSTNRLCSVGLNLDIDRHPPTGLPPEEEFRRFVARHPALARQFERATAFREWTSSDRLQFSSSRAVGERYCLVPHAFSFVDPLFSSGLGIAMGAVNMLAQRLIQSKKDGDWSEARFAPIETRMRRNFDYFDRLVANCYASFADYGLWNAWHRVWMLGGVYGASGILEILGRYFGREGDTSVFAACEELPYAGIQACELPEYAALFDTCARDVEAVHRGERTAQEATRRIYAAMDASGLWPRVWGGPPNPDVRHPGVFTIDRMIALMLWVQREAPACLRDHYYCNLRSADMMKLMAKDWASEIETSGGAMAVLARDFVRASNRDWERVD